MTKRKNKLIAHQDTLWHIFSFLPVEDLGRLARVCKDWKRASETPSLWKKYSSEDDLKFLSGKADTNWKLVVVDQIVEARNNRNISWASPNENHDAMVKILVIGDSAVGKTSVIKALKGRPFSSTYRYTIGVDFEMHDVSVGDVNLKLQLWDLGGREFTRHPGRAFFRGSYAALLLYDVSRKSTFDNLHLWLKELREQEDGPLHVVICGNKTDLPAQVTTEQAENFAKKNKCKFILTSAKENKNVQQAVLTAVDSLKYCNKQFARTPKREPPAPKPPKPRSTSVGFAVTAAAVFAGITAAVISFATRTLTSG
jgi:small GTP-binding protein